MSLGTFRRRPVRRRWVFGVTTTAAMASMVFFIASAAGVLSGSPSKFESGDGNMIVDTTGNSDWKTVNFVKVTDSTSNTDNSFVGGDKQDTPCPDVEGHSNPPKDDFTAVASYSETSSANQHTYLYGATVRVAANGNAAENIELKQGKNGFCPGSVLLQRTADDKLIAIDYLNGGTTVEFNVLTWVLSGACYVSQHAAPCWGANVQTLTANAAEGRTNQTAITAANNPITNENLVANRFAEFGIDLTAAGIIPPGECKAFPQTIWESRAAGSSFTSQVKDISIENNVISNCGSIKIIKQTNPRGINQVFGYTSNLTPNSAAGGVTCPGKSSAGVQSDGSFCLNDTGNSGKTLGSGDAAQNSAGNTVSETELFPGTYTVTENTPPSGFAFNKITCSGGTTSINNTTRAVSITLGVNDVVVCIYQNDQQLGAIRIKKVSNKAAETALAGAKFRICTNNGPYDASNPCSPAKTGSDDLSTGSDGTVCVDGLGFGDYYVSEKSPPTGYAVDDTTVHKVTVDNNAKCSDTTFGGEEIKFKDTPLTDLKVEVKSQVSGGTASRVACVGPSPATTDVGNSPQPPDSNGQQTFGDPVTLTANGLSPGTYTCTVIIDP